MRMSKRWMMQMGLLLVLLLSSGCAGPQETEDDGADALPEVERVAMNLAPADEAVRTIQLYRGGDERAQPILPLGGGGQLTLEFDLLEASGRPLSVYFYHADRTWRRDLTPVEYLDAFRSDNLLDYTASRGTDVAYTHYTYRFPNESIGFRLSGNYVLRVTEQGQEDAVLFERAFFVTEQTGALALGIDNVMVSGQGLPSERPVAEYAPPPSLGQSVFDYTVCFVRNGAFAAPRCTDQARPAGQAALAFDLRRRRAFAPGAARYGLDLGALQVGGEIESTDRTTSPPEVTLAPDYANFPGTGFGTVLGGQVLVEEAVRDAPDPDIDAEYARVRFSFVPPDEQPLYGDVLLYGSFAPRHAEPAARLSWAPARNRYEGAVLLKQGRYEYYYTAPDPRLRRVLERALPSLRNSYLAFVYYRDISRGTDRLLAVQGAVTR